MIHIHPFAVDAIGLSIQAANTLNTTASATYPSSNRALFVPFRLFVSFTATRMFSYNGASVSGNIDVGIYSSEGNRIVSSGSTAQAGTNALQEFDLTDTTLVPGLYYMAVSMDNTTGTLFRSVLGVRNVRLANMMQMASAFPLPASATFAGCVTSYGPVIGVSNRSFV